MTKSTVPRRGVLKLLGLTGAAGVSLPRGAGAPVPATPVTLPLWGQPQSIKAYWRTLTPADFEPTPLLRDGPVNLSYGLGQDRTPPDVIHGSMTLDGAMAEEMREQLERQVKRHLQRPGGQPLQIAPSNAAWRRRRRLQIEAELLQGWPPHILANRSHAPWFRAQCAARWRVAREEEQQVGIGQDKED
jgi:hypothetical protein